jgi:Glycosyltransferase family 87
MFTLPIAARSRNILFLLLVIFCGACMVYYHLALFLPRAREIRAGQGFGNGYSFGADFYPIWLTSRMSLLHRRNLYSPEMTGQIQIGLFGRALDVSIPAASSDYRAFAYPAFVDVLFWPVALLPFSVVRIWLAVILPALTAFSVVLWLRALRLRAGPVTLAALVLLTVSSYAVLEGLFAEQLGLLAGFLLAASLAALVNGRLSLSGSLLALTLIKPQMTALVVAYLLLWSFDQWRGRWRFAGSFFFTSALLAASSLLVWPGWVRQWLQVVLGYRHYSTPPLVGYLLGTNVGSRLTPFLITIILLTAIVLAWRVRRASPTSTEFALTVSLLLAITAVTLLPGHAVYDHVILLPGVILIALSWRVFARSSPIFRVVLGVTAVTFFWQWILAPAVIAARPLVSSQLFASALLTLPIRTAASIPFGVLALLALMMRQVTRKQIGGGNT